ncbi:hypothetical protein [Streptomyces albidus (ex Kaewkla and Franco 2022)]|uniref:hypothetical protein n=1 Tax=Streptomyces albidus (ex Kaewkla and Franco 2022) TaxID=722709 RepID=UPI0015EE759A|nr:hypothetical protein [Streptomyces albidus (ex Kaewkla and Franco 2022)]
MTSGNGGSEEQETGTVGGGGAVHIGSISGGSVATGRHGRATSTSYTYNSPPQQTDEATLALLEAVRALRADMSVLAASDETRGVDGELGEIEGEIARTGRTDPTRLARLRERLESGASAIGLLASAATVAQAAAQVLG